MMIPVTILSTAIDVSLTLSGTEKPRGSEAKESVEKKGFNDFLKEATGSREIKSDSEEGRPVDQKRPDPRSDQKDKIEGQPEKSTDDKTPEKAQKKKREPREEEITGAKEEKSRAPEAERSSTSAERMHPRINLLDGIHYKKEPPFRENGKGAESSRFSTEKQRSIEPRMREPETPTRNDIRGMNGAPDRGKDVKKAKPTKEDLSIKKEVKEKAPNRKEAESGSVALLLDPEKWKIHGKFRTDREAETPKVEPESKGLHFRRSSFDERRGETKHQNERDPQSQQGLSLTKSELKPLTHSFMETSGNGFRNQLSELVERAHVNITPEGNSSASIRLNPESLGRLTMNLRVVNNTLEANLVVESDQVRKMIQSEIESLRNELRGHGIQVETFSVRVRESFLSFDQSGAGDAESRFGTGTESHGGAFSGNRDESDDFSSFFAHKYSGNIDDMEYETVGRSVRSEHDGALNVRL